MLLVCLLTGCRSDDGLIQFAGSVAMLAVITPVVIAKNMGKKQQEDDSVPKHCKNKHARGLFDYGDRLVVDVSFKIQDGNHLIQLEDRVICNFQGWTCLSNNNETFQELAWPLSSGDELIYETPRMCQFAVDYMVKCHQKACPDARNQFHFQLKKQRKPVPAHQLDKHGLDILTYQVQVEKQHIPDISH